MSPLDNAGDAAYGHLHDAMTAYLRGWLGVALQAIDLETPPVGPAQSDSDYRLMRRRQSHARRGARLTVSVRTIEWRTQTPTMPAAPCAPAAAGDPILQSRQAVDSSEQTPSSGYLTAGNLTGIGTRRNRAQ